MATATSKKKVNTTSTVGIENNSVDAIVEAQKFLGAPGTAGVSVNPGPLSYVTNEDGSVQQALDTYNVTFSWSEEK